MTLIIVALIVVVLGGAFVGVTLKKRNRPELGAGPQATPLPEGTDQGNVEATTTTDEVSDLEPELVVEDNADVAPSYRERMGRSRGLFDKLRSKVGRNVIEQDDLDDLEEALIRADVGVVTTQKILEAVKDAKKSGAEGDLVDLVRGELLNILTANDEHRPLDPSASSDRVPVWLFVGVNGVGKTTTIGKIAYAKAGEQAKVVLAAGDTFRAAAGEQLETWGERSNAEVVRGAEGADPSAVIFDAIQRAKARGANLVLADTAGRLHTKVNLVEELKKIRRVSDREPGHVAETLLVLDATTGQNGLVQAKEFLEATGVTGVVLTKLDGSAKGGVVIAIEAELGIPVKLVGLGEGAADLVTFEPESFVDALLAR